MGDRACVAIVKQGHILMVQQTYRGTTVWTFPGGGIKAGETPQAAAIREVKEETTLDIATTKLLCQMPRVQASGTYYCYLGQFTGGQATLGHDPELSSEEQELYKLCWFPLNEMRTHPEVSRIWHLLLEDAEFSQG